MAFGQKVPGHFFPHSAAHVLYDPRGVRKNREGFLKEMAIYKATEYFDKIIMLTINILPAML